MGKPRIILRQTPMIVKEIGIMKKLLGLYANSKIRDPIQNKLNPMPAMKEGVPDFLSQTKGIGTKHVTRRQVVLNRHFTEIVSDVLALNLKRQLHELGVTITSIETKAWNKGVNIFYTTKDGFDESLHQELQSLISELRFAITERRMIGRTPHIRFVHDKSIAWDKLLDESIAKVEEPSEREDKEIIVSEMNRLYISKDLGSQEETLVSNKFVAPSDMNNTLLGLDYPSLYDKVASNLARGRGESARMMSGTSLFPSAKPIFKSPNEDEDIENPMKRILRMKRFLVNQKKRSERMSRERRQQELLARDRVKWDLPDDNDEVVEPPLEPPNNQNVE